MSSGEFKKPERGIVVALHAPQSKLPQCAPREELPGQRGRESQEAAAGLVDRVEASLYSWRDEGLRMSVKRVLLGQVWKKQDTGDTYLVTKIYNEALATFAVMRKTGSESDAPLRVKILREGETQSIPGFLYTQDSDNF